MLLLFVVVALSMALHVRTWIRDGAPWGAWLWTAADVEELDRMGIAFDDHVSPSCNLTR